MRRGIALVLLAGWTLFAQGPATSNLTRLADDLDAAMQAGDWNKAVEISHALKVAASEARDASLSAQGGELADTILGWLPVDTEAFVVAQQPFKISEDQRSGIPNDLEIARGFVLALLSAPEKGKLAKALLGRTVRLAAMGRRFGVDLEENPPSDKPVPLGMMPYEGCGIYALVEPPGEGIFGRPPDGSVLGLRVWISKGTQNDTPDRETYEVAFLKPDVIMSCNNHWFFEQMAARMGAPADVRALPSSLPEWRYVNRKAAVWGLCHYTEKTAWIPSLTGAEPDAHASGVAVQFGLDGGVSKAIMLAQSNPWQKMEANPQFDKGKFSQPSTGVWEFSFAEEEMGAALAFMGYLGFVLLL